MRNIFFVLIILVSFGCSKSKPSYEPLSLQWARYVAGNPGGEEGKNKNKKLFVDNAKKLSTQGYRLYQQKDDKGAIKKYEAALKLHATGELYFRYGNSLSNILRLGDSAKSYKIALALGYTNSGYTAYNLACVYSKNNQWRTSYEYLMQAVQSGYNQFGYIKVDADLENLRMHLKSKYLAHRWLTDLMLIRKNRMMAFGLQKKLFSALCRNNIGSAKKIIAVSGRNQVDTFYFKDLLEDSIKQKKDPILVFFIKYLKYSTIEMCGIYFYAMEEGKIPILELMLAEGLITFQSLMEDIIKKNKLALLRRLSKEIISKHNGFSREMILSAIKNDAHLVLPYLLKSMAVSNTNSRFSHQNILLAIENDAHSVLPYMLKSMVIADTNNAFPNLLKIARLKNKGGVYAELLKWGIKKNKLKFKSSMSRYIEKCIGKKMTMNRFQVIEITFLSITNFGQYSSGRYCMRHRKMSQIYNHSELHSGTYSLFGDILVFHESELKSDNSINLDVIHLITIDGFRNIRSLNWRSMGIRKNL